LSGGIKKITKNLKILEDLKQTPLAQDQHKRIEIMISVFKRWQEIITLTLAKIVLTEILIDAATQDAIDFKQAEAALEVEYNKAIDEVDAFLEFWIEFSV
jgi:hypothetical protein